MSVNSSVQQFSGGLAAWLSGTIIGEGPSGRITGYAAAGAVAATLVLTCIWLARFLRPVPTELSPAGVSVESV